MRKTSIQALSRRSALVLTVAAMATASAAYGQTWTGLAGDGLFSTPGNWNTSSTPASDPSTVVTFGGASGYTVTVDPLVPTPFTLNGMIFNGSGSDISLTGGILSFDGLAPSITQLGSANVGIGSGINIVSSLTVGGTGTGSVSLTGTLTGDLNSTLAMTGGFALNLGSGSIGMISQTSGTLNVLGSLTLTNATTALSAGASSGVAKVNIGAGGVLTATGGIFLGAADGTNGLLTVSGGGLINGSLGLVAGNGTGSTGDVSVTGTGTVLTFTSSNFLAGNGTNSHSGVSISSGGTVVSSNMFLGQGNGSTTTLSIAGGTMQETSTSTNSFSTIGSGAASLVNVTISGGGTLSTGNSLIGGFGTNSVAGITVTGTGSKLTTGANLQLGSAGNVTSYLSVLGGGSVAATGTFFTSLGSGTYTGVSLTGSSSLTASTLVLSGGFGSATFAGTTDLTIGSGSKLTLSNSLVAVNATSGIANISVTAGGSLSTGNVANTLGGGTNGHVGLSVSGAGASAAFNGSTTATPLSVSSVPGAVTNISISNGGAMSTAGYFWVANNATATGSQFGMTVTGSGSRFTTAQQSVFSAAPLSTSSLTVSAGGSFASTGAIFTALGTNTVAGITVTGTGSQLSSGSGITLAGGNGSAAFSGQAELLVTNGAKVVLGSTLTGVNSTGGTARVTVSAGGSLVATALSMAVGTNSTAGMYVTGAGSTVTSSGQVLLGNALGAKGYLSVANGALYSVTGNTFMSLVSNTYSSMAFAGSTTTSTLTGALIMSGGGGAVQSGVSELLVTSGAKLTVTTSLQGGTGIGGTVNVTVSAGGSFNLGTNLQLGSGTNDFGGLMATGAGSSVTAATFFLATTIGAQAAINVQDNATVTATGSTFACYAANTATNITIGTGGRLVLTGQTQFGSNGSAGGGATSVVMTGSSSMSIGNTLFSASVNTSSTSISVGGSSTFTGIAAQLGLNGTTQGGTSVFGVTGSGLATFSDVVYIGQLGTIVASGGTLAAKAVSSNGTTQTGSIQLSGGTVTLTGNGLTGLTGYTSSAALSGSTGTLAVNGPNLFQVFANPASTFSGQVSLVQGVLDIAATGAVGTSGTITLGGPSTTAQAQLTLEAGVNVTRDLALASNAASATLLAVNGLDGFTSIVSGNVTLAGGRNLSIFSGSAATFLTGSVSGTGGIANFSGTTTMSGPLSYSGNTTVLASNLIIASPLTTSASLSLTTNAAVANFTAPALAGSHSVVGSFATVTSSGVITLAQTDRNSALSTLFVAGTLTLTGGQLNLANNDMIVHGTAESVLDAYVTSGLLKSSGSTDTFTGLAVITDSDGRGGALYATFDGVAVVATDVLVKYTYIGDTDLNGVVNGSDLANLLAGMSGGLTGYGNGDLNYDGHVDGTDLSLLLASLGGQGASLGDSTGPVGAVPEPVALAPLAGIAMFAGRRRRR